MKKQVSPKEFYLRNNEGHLKGFQTNLKRNICFWRKFLCLLSLTKVLFHDQRGLGLSQVSKVIMFTPSSRVFDMSHELIVPCARHSSRLLGWEACFDSHLFPLVCPAFFFLVVYISNTGHFSWPAPLLGKHIITCPETFLFKDFSRTNHIFSRIFLSTQFDIPGTCNPPLMQFKNPKRW